MNEHVVINSDKTMEIPEWLKDWLVQYDHKTTTITFDCPRRWRGIDLLEYAIYVSVIKKGKEPHTDLCENVCADENNSEMIHFDWKPTKAALSEKGELSFLICARITEDETIEGAWHTKICRMIKVAEGHECQIIDEEQYEDIITELVLQMKAISEQLANGGGSGGTPNAVQYVEQTLTEEQQAQARGNIGAASAEEVGQLQEEIVDKATLENGVIKFYKSGETDKELFKVDLSSLSGGLDLANLSMTITAIDSGNRLTLSDGTTTKYVDIPAVSVTDEQIESLVNAWLDEHPEATTIEDGSVTIKKLADSVFVVRKTTLIQSNGGMPIFAFPLDGIANDTVSVKATVTLLTENEVSFSLRISESDSDTNVGSLTPIQTETLNKDKPSAILDGTFSVTDKPYLACLMHTGNATCDFYIDIEMTYGEIKLDNPQITFNWGTGTASEYILEGQERGALVTAETAKKLIAESLEKAKEYTNESLEEYVYEIPDKSVPMKKLSDSAFELDRYSILTLSNGDFAFMSFDISDIENRNGKTANIEYYYTALDDNFTSLSHKAGTGNTTGQYDNAVFNGTVSVIDEENKIYKWNATYPIASDEHIFLNLYPQITATAETQVKFYGVTVTVDGEKLEWVEAHRFSGGTVFPIVGVYQEGNYLLKLEYAEKLISEAIGSVEKSVNDAKDEVAQLKELIGDGSNTVVESVLNGKKWGTIGDSITFGTGTTDQETTYHKYISEKYLMTISNQGVAGKCIALRPTYNDTMISNVGNLPTDCDFVTVFGGTNDYGNSITIGTFADTTNETFYGALKLMCEALYERFGSKKIAFFTPTQRTDGNNPNNVSKTLKDYRDVIIEVCAYYGIPVLDLYAESGINPKLYNGFTGDGLHLNDAGHERISHMIAKFLERI